MALVNRGVAVYQAGVFVGTVDDRLGPLDASSGNEVWSRDTVIDHFYTVTGAPRVYRGNVVIGNGGGEYGVRGYVTAYHAKTGKQV